MSNMICDTCKVNSSICCPSKSCEVLKNAFDGLEEENDELRVELHDYKVMVGLLIYLLKG